MIKCALTGDVLTKPIYDSNSDKSVTSLSKIYKGPTIIYCNERIGHLQTIEIEGIDQYYDQEYQIFDESEEDDILYKVIDGQKIFRQQHQVDTLQKKVNLEDGMQILDYGCAKGTVLKRLKAQRPEIIPYLFDVSQMYVPLWNKFLNEEQYSSYSPKEEWEEKFDVVTSFFAFEHTPDPLKELASIRNLLKPNGIFYMIVPNVYENIGDLIVVDHIHHYSEVSLRYMMGAAGFEVIEIDSQSHFAAFIVIARKNPTNSSLHSTALKNDLSDINKQINQIVEYWSTRKNNIQEFEKNNSSKNSAIYGAGVSGVFISTCLNDFDAINYFMDQNPLLKDTQILGKPVINPCQIDEKIETIYVGLNPRIAHQAIENMGGAFSQGRNFFYL